MLSRSELIKRLCWEDRLLNNDWKVRYNANIELKLLCDSVTDPKDHRILEFGNLFKETVIEPVVLVQDMVFDALIAYLKAADANVAGGFASEICDAILSNCLTDRIETVSKAQIVFMLWVELEAVEAVMDAMEKAIKNQVAKAVAFALDFMFQAISEFGSKIVPPNRLFKMLMEIYDHQDQNICASSKTLTLELCLWIGRDPDKSILFEKMSDTLKIELGAELANVIAVAKPTRKIRSEQMKEPELKVATDATHSRTSKESAVKIPLGRDEYELVDPVDILTPLEKSGFWNKVKSKKLNKRKEAVAKLTKLASTKRIAPGEYTELCHILEKLLTDLSIAVRVGAVRAIGNLALGLRINFSSYSRALVPVLLSKLTEKKPIMEEALTTTLQVIYNARCVTLTEILIYVRAVIKSEDPHVCSRTLNWVMYCITSSHKRVVRKVHNDYVQICLECLDNGTAEVKDAAFSVLLAIEKSVGIRLLNMSLEKLDYARNRMLSKMPSEMTLKQNDSILESLIQEHSITQPKNVASKDPLEAIKYTETNQLQEISLSDSQEHNKSESVYEEQNKKRKHHNGSKKGYHHFVKSVWGRDVVTDDDEDLEAWMEELAWIKSLECTRCGINCVCKQELDFDTDEILSSDGEDEALKRGPDPAPWSPW